jgi:hypothetical protein
MVMPVMRAFLVTLPRTTKAISAMAMNAATMAISQLETGWARRIAPSHCWLWLAVTSGRNRGLCCAALRCAVLRCAVLCCAVLRHLLVS